VKFVIELCRTATANTSLPRQSASLHMQRAECILYSTSQLCGWVKSLLFTACYHRYY